MIVEVAGRRPVSGARASDGVGSSFALIAAAMATVSITSPRPATWTGASGRALSLPWPRARVAVVACATLLAALVRIGGLDTYGFSEDEINKVRAIQQYRSGDFGANAEHPMLMKLAMLGSVELSEAWNRIAPADAAMSLETAVRLPNALAGALRSEERRV